MLCGFCRASIRKFLLHSSLTTTEDKQANRAPGFTVSWISSCVKCIPLKQVLQTMYGLDTLCTGAAQGIFESSRRIAQSRTPTPPSPCIRSRYDVEISVLEGFKGSQKHDYVPPTTRQKAHIHVMLNAARHSDLRRHLCQFSGREEAEAIHAVCYMLPMVLEPVWCLEEWLER